MPSDAISARRWSKMAQSLKALGHDIEVICLNRNGTGNFFGKSSDLIPVFEIKESYPRSVDREPVSLIDKIKYRAGLVYLKLFSNGTIYDRAIFDGKRLKQLVTERIMEFNPDTIVSNGPPHRIMFYTTQLKQKFPKILFISDFRDPWTWWYNLGYPSLNKRRMTKELEMEKSVVHNSDIIISPAKKILEFLEARYPDQKKKYVHIMHGYDETDFEPAEVKPSRVPRSEINLFYFGNIYNRLETEIESICQIISSMSVSIDFFTNANSYVDIVKRYDLEEMVQYHAPQKLSSLLHQMDLYDGILFIVPRDLKDFLPSKAAEMIKFRKPVLVIAKQGEISDFFTSNKIGILVDMDNLSSELPLALQKLKHGFDYNKSFDLEEFSFSKLSERFIHETAINSKK